MRKLLKIGALIVFPLVFGLISCSTEETPTSIHNTTVIIDGNGTSANSASISDQSLENKINDALEAQVSDGSFTVVSEKGNILLAGQVPDVYSKDKAVRAVKNIVGIKRIWNYLTIEPNESNADIAADALITSKAKGKLLMHKGVRANNIKVVTSNGVVFLLGEHAGKRNHINKVIKDISQIDGVTDVVNLVKP